MFVSYEMQDQNDVRGFIKLVKGRGTGVKDIAYATVPSIDGDMIELTQAEIEAVEQSLDATPWLDWREDACKKVDATADAVRASYMDGGANVDIEYYRVQEDVKAWRNAGSDYNALPVRIADWMDAANLTPEQAVSTIEQQITVYDDVITEIRRLRLHAKRDIMNSDASQVNLVSVYETAISALNALKQS